MTRMNYDKEKYFFNQNCATCKHSSHYCTILTVKCYCHVFYCPTEKEFVCDFYKLSRSKAKQNLKVR